MQRGDGEQGAPVCGRSPAVSESSLFDEQEAAARRQRAHDEFVADLAEVYAEEEYSHIHEPLRSDLSRRLAQDHVRRLKDRGWTFTPPPF